MPFLGRFFKKPPESTQKETHPDVFLVLDRFDNAIYLTNSREEPQVLDPQSGGIVFSEDENAFPLTIDTHHIITSYDLTIGTLRGYGHETETDLLENKLGPYIQKRKIDKQEFQEAISDVEISLGKY